MRKLLIPILAQIALVCASNALACEEPAAISVPDGDTASEAQMNVAGAAYHQYMIDMQLYQVCLNDAAELERRRNDRASRASTAARENEYAALHNAASSAMVRTTAAFERAVEAFQARQEG